MEMKSKLFIIAVFQTKVRWIRMQWNQNRLIIIKNTYKVKFGTYRKLYVPSSGIQILRFCLNFVSQLAKQVTVL